MSIGSADIIGVWQIGSGPTEAMCKTTTARLKRCGMRWDADNADTLMALAGLDR